MAEATDIQQQRAIEAAQGYLMLDLPDAALRRLGIFADSDVASPAVEQLRGEAFRLKEDYERSAAALRTRFDDAENLDLQMGKAWCFKRTGRLDKAIESMRAAYRGSPKVAIVLYNLACYFSLAGEKEEALSWLARAFRMDSSLQTCAA